MGSFPGHALPGSFFILFGLWYTIQAFRRYFKCRETGTKFKSTMIFPCPCLCGRLKDWPCEAMLKIFCCCVGIVVEITAGFTDGKFTAMGNGQHATMFFFFGLSGLIDILLHFKAPLPPNIDYISFALAFTVEGLLFKFHLYGRSPLDVLVHTLLIYVVGASVVSSLLEIRYRHHLLSPLTRGYLLMVQGTWFWHVGNILYPPLGPKWDENDHEQLMIATLYFTWHAGVNFVVVLLIGGIIACRYRNRNIYYKDELRKMKLSKGTGNHSILFVNDGNEEGSDEESEKQETET